MGPVDDSAKAARSYRGDTLVLETQSETADRSVALIDFRPCGQEELLGGEAHRRPCSFWLVDASALLCRHADARALFERLVLLANDVGLLAEAYDPKSKRQVGNLPQAFSHVALVGAALQLRDDGAPARSRSDEHGMRP